MAERSVFLEIEGMTCESCAESIRRSLTQDAGVKEARIDWTYGIAEITFDPDATDEEKILENQVFRRQYKARLGHAGSCC